MANVRRKNPHHDHVSIADPQPKYFHRLLNLSIYQKILKDSQGRIVGGIHNKLCHQPCRNSCGGHNSTLQPQRQPWLIARGEGKTEGTFRGS